MATQVAPVGLDHEEGRLDILKYCVQIPRPRIEASDHGLGPFGDQGVQSGAATRERLDLMTLGQKGPGKLSADPSGGPDDSNPHHDLQDL